MPTPQGRLSLSRLLPPREWWAEWILGRVLRQYVPVRHPCGFELLFEARERPTHTLRHGFDDRGLIRCLQARLRPGQTVLDVGGCRGAVTIAASRAVGLKGRVICFEPDPDNYARLLMNLRRNGSPANVTVVNAAVFDRVCQLELQQFGHQARGWSTLGRFELNGRQPVASVPVQTVTLDGYCREQGIGRIDVLKIDAEGAEPRVLAGARELLARGAVGEIFFEISKAPLEGLGHTIDDVLNPLLACGCRFEQVRTDGSTEPIDAATIHNSFWGDYRAVLPAKDEVRAAA